MGTGVGNRKRSQGRHAVLAVLVWLSIFFASACLAQRTEEHKVLTLNEALEIALKNQPAIEAQYGQVLVGEAKTGQAREATIRASALAVHIQGSGL